MRLEELKNKKILILGFGREGQDTFKFLRKLFPEKVLGVGDRKKIFNLVKKDKKIRLHLGESYLKAIKNYDVVIKSPGISSKVIEPYLTKKQKVTSQTKIFFENCSGKIIGVCGTKGKSTTSSLIYQLLKQTGFRTYLIGNIGKPVLNFLFSTKPQNVYVYELSSYQLSNLKKRPQISVFLNIYFDHLDYYQNFKKYCSDEINITKYQTKENYLIYNCQDKIIREAVKKSKAKKIPIKGQYFELNKNAVRAIGELFRIPKIIIEKIISQFKPLFHRLEYIGEFQKIKFYNDSASTIPEATIAAIKILGKRLETILLGGSNKGLDFKNLAREILKSKIKNLILFPPTGKIIWQEITKINKERLSSNLPKASFIDNIREAVKLAYSQTKKGKICLLSPASASFSLFRDYKERGNFFKKFVKYYGQKD